jgi:two-component system chemotaxis response regulator CheB
LSSLRGPPPNPDSILSSAVETPAFDVVVIGASAGGLTAVSKVLGELPTPFPVAIALVLHLSPDHPSVLADVLARCTQLPVVWARDGERLIPGTIVVAPPDRHLVIGAGGTIALVLSPRKHFSRPAVDLLFTSAARVFERRTLGVVLSGNGHDGSEGALAVYHAGGVVIAQDRASSEYFSMPREAIESGGVTFVLPLNEIAAAVIRLATLGAGGGVASPPAR